MNSQRFTLATLVLLAACSSSPEPESLLGAQATTTTIRIPLVKAADDAEEVRSGSMSVGGGLLDFNEKTGTSQTVGIRFQNIAVPQGAKVTGVRLEVRGGRADADPVRLLVTGEATADAATFTSSKNNLSSRKKTAATSLWRPNPWKKGGLYKTGDLSAIVQEVVDHKDWESGNALAFFVDGAGGAGKRSAVAYETSAKHRPVLVVTFATSGGGVAPTPEPEPAPAPQPTPEPEPVTPSNPGNVSSSQREWHKRLMASIKSPRYDPDLDPNRLFSSGDIYRMGRNGNQYITALSMAYRETGDRDIAREIDRVMNKAKGQLRDTNGDGYKNFRWLLKRDSDYGKDYHEMDEILTHSMIASAAYTLKQAGYSSSARFWTDYLENDFEAKWRKRNGKRSGFPFMDKSLMHPYANFIRYHHYMYKLTGDSGYNSEAKRMVSVVKRNMRSSGGALVWPHRVKYSGGSSSGDCQTMVYVRLSMLAFADMGSQGVFDSSFMKGVAKAMATKGLKSSTLAGNICGSGSYGTYRTAAPHPYTVLAAWDSSGKLNAAAERAYAATERRSMSSPDSANVPAIMVFTKGR